MSYGQCYPFALVESEYTDYDWTVVHRFINTHTNYAAGIIQVFGYHIICSK